MTEDQKEILIAKMLDAPSSLSDEDLDAILHDDELLDIYETSATISSAYIRQPELDMEQEWERFRPRIRRKPTAMRWVNLVAAIFLGVLFASSIAVSIIEIVFTPDQPPVIAKVEQSKVLDTPQPNLHSTESEEKTKSDPTINKSHPPMTSQSPVTNRRPTKNTETVEIPESQMETDTDIADYMRIQQARVDNDLAMQAAESYLEEYDDIVLLLNAVGAYRPEIDGAIGKITME